jgi:hypothetical protein
MNKSSNQKNITVVFRYDDFSSFSSTSIETKLLNAFHIHQAIGTFGAIPFVVDGVAEDPTPQNNMPLTQEKIDILRKAIKQKVVEVALHGTTHQTIGEKGTYGWTEFAGLEYSTQVDKITRGKNYLEEKLGIKIATFIPPWNSYDLNTLLALEALEFETISSGIRCYTNSPTKLKFLPYTCSLSDLQNAVSFARKGHDRQPIIVVLIHAYDFQEDNNPKAKLSFQDFNNLLSWLTSQEDICIRTISEVTSILDGFDFGRYKKYSYLATSVRRRFFSNQLSYYPSSRILDALKARYIVTLTFSLVIAIAVIFLILFFSFAR